MTVATRQRPRQEEQEQGSNGTQHTASGGTEHLTKGLGWFSIGLGLAEVMAPRTVARMIGARPTDSNHNILMVMGLREITNGVGLLARPQQPAWLWGRVGGDVMDLAFLGKELNATNTDRTRLTAATAAVLGVTILDIVAGQQLGRQRTNGNGAGSQKQRGIDVRKSITVNRTAEDVYRFWRDFQNLPRFMSHLEAVKVIDERRSEWTAKAPAGTRVSWTAEIAEDVPNQSISWRSLPDADVPNSGTVRFLPAPGDRGTEIHVQLQYQPPAGILGATIAKLFGEEPGQQVMGDLRRFKQVMEAGEVVHSDASIHRGPHPARPAAHPM